MTAIAVDKKRFPPQVKYIVGNEGCERYSYYGMRSILTVYMVNYLLMQEHFATEVMHLFMGFSYFFPLFGSFLADRFLGRYKTILYLSLFYCIGHGILAVCEGSVWGLYAGLFFIVLGAGGIKPCISAFVGDQFKAGQEDLVSKVYSLFYFMINFGSTFSSVLTPLTLKYYGPGIAFGIPGILMGIATIIFWIGTPQYSHIPPSGKDPHSVWAVLFAGLRGFFTGKGFYHYVTGRFPAVRVDEFHSAMNVAKVFAMVTVFWGLFDQHASTWVLQAEKMKGDVTLGSWSFQILSSQMSSANPIIVMILIPVFVMYVYPAFDKFYPMTALRKMGWGFVVAALGFATSAFIQYTLEEGQQVHMLWQVIPYTFMTIAEVMISITGLEFAYTQAPKTIKSTIMSFWFLTVFFGNMMTAVIVNIGVFPVGSGHFFMLFAALVFLAGVAFAFLVRNYQMRSYLVQE